MMEKNWHNLEWEEIVRKFNSNIEKGLPEKEAWQRQRTFGRNSLPKEKPLSRVRIFFEQLKSPLIYILIIAGLITLFLREFADSTVIFIAVLLNTLVGYFQENKTCQALRALKKIVKIEVQVIRDGNELKIDSEDLVPGDIIVLTTGNKVPADGRLIESYNLKIREAPLTGEWLLAGKKTDTLPVETPVADRDNMVYMGCTIEEGKGKAIITEIGSDTEVGRVAAMIKEAKEEKTPLQKKLAHLSRTIGSIIVFICIFIFVEGVIRGGEFLEMFETSVAVAVAAIPEGLPVALTVILALGMERILKRKGLVRKLVAAETLGSTSIVASDKTLTLTQGKMEVAETVAKDQTLLMTIAALANEAFVENPYDLPPIWRVRGRPTDKALLLAAAKSGVKKWELEKKYPKVNEIPFNPENKFIATLHQIDKQGIVYVSGAPEKILELSKIDKETFSKLDSQLRDLTSRGLRVVAAAYKEISGLQSAAYNLEEEINDLTFVGFLALKDPLREEAKEAIEVCKRAGMKPIIVTGDHLLTAKAIAQELDLKTARENIIEGKELDKISEEDFKERVKDIEIYARVEPRHKLRIIEAWQKRGEVVAMTGDGINDAPALKQANIGVALGSGTDVAKEVSDLVLLTDNFNIIPAAVEEGRAIVDNIRKVITYLLSDSFTETILIGLSIVFGWPLPVTAVQILWVNLIEDGLPNIALAFEPKEKDLMKRKPEKKTSLFTREMKTIIFIIGIFTDLILIGLFFWLLGKFGRENLPHIQTVMFACLGIDSLFYVFSCKNLRKNIWQINIFSNAFLLIAWFVGFLALFLALYLPLFRTLLGTVPLEAFDWLIILGLGFINLLLIEAAKYYFIARHQTD